MTQFRTVTFGLSKRRTCQEASKWRLLSAGRVNAGGQPFFRGQRSWESTTRPTEAAWLLQGRSTSVRVCQPSSRRCSEKKAWSTLCNIDEAVSSQDTFTPCSSEASLWLRFTTSQACEPQGSTCGSWRRLRPAYFASVDPGSPWGSGIWSRRTWPKLAGSTRSTARSLPPRLLLVQGEQERSSTTSCFPRRWHTCPTSGTVKARRATGPPGHTPTWWRQQRGGSSRRLPCYSIWQSSTSTSGTITSGRRAITHTMWPYMCMCTTSGKKAAKPVFPRDCWLVRVFGTILAGCSGATTAATLFETVAAHRLWNVAGTPKMVQVLTAEAVEGLQARDLPLSKGKSKVLIDGPDKLKHALLQQLEALGIDECDTARNVGADLQLGRRLRALVDKGRLARAAKRTKRVRQLRKAGAGVPRFWASLRHSIRVDPTSSTGHLGLGNRSLGRNSRPRHHAGRAARLTGQAQSSQAALVRRNGRSGHLCAHALAAWLERAVSEAPYDPRWHQDRLPGCCAQNGGLLGGPVIPFVV